MDKGEFAYRWSCMQSHAIQPCWRGGLSHDMSCTNSNSFSFRVTKLLLTYLVKKETAFKGHFKEGYYGLSIYVVIKFMCWPPSPPRWWHLEMGSLGGDKVMSMEHTILRKNIPESSLTQPMGWELEGELAMSQKADPCPMRMLWAHNLEVQFPKPWEINLRCSAATRRWHLIMALRQKQWGKEEAEASKPFLLHI